MYTSPPAIGTRVTFRHWDSNPWLTGTIESYFTGAFDDREYVTIKRDGYRETHTLPVSKLSNPTLVTDCVANTHTLTIDSGTDACTGDYPSYAAARAAAVEAAAVDGLTVDATYVAKVGDAIVREIGTFNDAHGDDVMDYQIEFEGDDYSTIAGAL
jgi:hypothetical protein